MSSSVVNGAQVHCAYVHMRLPMPTCLGTSTLYTCVEGVQPQNICMCYCIALLL